MVTGLLSVLTLGVIAAMVYQFVRSGSQGPAETTAVGNTVVGFYKTLMK